VSSDAPEATTDPLTNPRMVLARRAEFVLIALGGVFIIGGWGFGHQEWARALGWICTGLGFAIELVYGRVRQASRAAAQEPATDAERTQPPATDDSAS